MYCPMCGKKLVEIERPEPDFDVDFDKDPPQAIWFKCESGHFGDNFPLVWHHPFKGIESKPGDSWSLSWIE